MTRFGETPPMLWYENERGERWVPDEAHYRYLTDPPEGFIYQHSRFPLELHDSICTKEGPLGHGSSSWPGDLVLALVRPTWREWLIGWFRYGTPGPTCGLEEAIIRAAGCEHCMNTLAHRVGLSWGYRAGSAEDRSRTSCEFCSHPSLPSQEPEPSSK